MALAVGAPRAPGAGAVRTITWPGDVVGPASVLVTPAALVTFGTFGVLGIPPDIVESDLPLLVNESKPTRDDQTQGDVHQLGSTQSTSKTWSKAGRLHFQVVTTGTHAYTNAEGVRVGSQRSTAIAYCNVLVCPNQTGVADGHVSLMLWQETTRADGSISGSVSTAEGDFSLIDGEDAHRTQTKLSLEMALGGFSGSEQTNWGRTQGLNFTWAPGQHSEINVEANTNWSWAGDVPEDAFVHVAPAVFAIKIVKELEKPVEEFWRSGKCIKLRPSEPSRDVEAGERITLQVEAKHRLDQQEVRAPIKGAFTGVKSLEPHAPVAPGQDFHFTAGPKENDTGNIAFTQTGIRGIGRESVTYRVRTGHLTFSVEGTTTVQQGAGAGKLRWSVAETKLVKDADGVYRGRGAFRGTLTIAGADFDALGGGLGEMEIAVTPDKADPKLFRVSTKLGPTSIAGTGRGGGTTGSGKGSIPGVASEEKLVPLGTTTLSPNADTTVTWILKRAPAAK